MSEGSKTGLFSPVKTVRMNGSGYPERLKELPFMPKVLYYRGELPDDGPAAAIVGARRCTPYGRHQAAYFAQVLAANGVRIISGMALGIDEAAQRAALEAGGLSFAVLGSGADICYPPSNRDLYDKLLKQGGILSEFEPGEKPLPWHFPVRNRVISGLSDVVIVIEARPDSGSLITADLALEQGRSVYALPGRVTDAYSEGCNALIAQGASAALSPQMILDELKSLPSWKKRRGAGGVTPGTGAIPESNKASAADEARAPGTDAGLSPDTGCFPDTGLSPDARRILKKLSDDPVPLEDLLTACALSPEAGTAAIAELLIAGDAEETAFHFYVRSGKKLAWSG